MLYLDMFCARHTMHYAQCETCQNRTCSCWLFYYKNNIIFHLSVRYYCCWYNKITYYSVFQVLQISAFCVALLDFLCSQCNVQFFSKGPLRREESGHCHSLSQGTRGETKKNPRNKHAAERRKTSKKATQLTLVRSNLKKKRRLKHTFVMNELSLQSKTPHM